MQNKTIERIMYVMIAMVGLIVVFIIKKAILFQGFKILIPISIVAVLSALMAGVIKTALDEDDLS